MHESYETPDGLLVQLRMPAGTVEVAAEDTDRTDLTIDRMKDENDFQVAFEPAAGGGHRLSIVHRKKGFSFGMGGRDARILIRCPVGTRIDVETGAADLDARGSLGSLELRGGAGDIAFDQVEGDVAVKVASGDVRGGVVGGSFTMYGASGDVRLQRVGGDVTAKNASGDIDVDEVGGSVTVTTVSGDVRLGSLRQGAAQIRAVSGDAEIGVVPGARVFLDLSSTSGEATTDLDMNPDDGERSLSLELRVHTVSGDIRVRRAAVG